MHLDELGCQGESDTCVVTKRQVGVDQRQSDLGELTSSFVRTTCRRNSVETLDHFRYILLGNADSGVLDSKLDVVVSVLDPDSNLALQSVLGSKTRMSVEGFTKLGRTGRTLKALPMMLKQIWKGCTSKSE